MTSPIDQLLARARLVDDPEQPLGIHPLVGSQPLPPALPTHPLTHDPRARDAAGDLRTLCETVVSHSSLTSLGDDFLTQTLPAPDAALILGCILQLGNAEEAARFWWQFAAGAGDHTASYCLVLHHRSLGEEAAAAWWQEQTPGATEPDQSEEPERLPPDLFPAFSRRPSLPATLRILSRLKRPERPERPSRPRPPILNAVLTYITSAVSFIDDDLELPLPEPEFIRRLRDLTTRGDTHPEPSLPVKPNQGTLPGRHRGGTAILAAQRHTEFRWFPTRP